MVHFSTAERYINLQPYSHKILPYTLILCISKCGMSLSLTSLIHPGFSLYDLLSCQSVHRFNLQGVQY